MDLDMATIGEFWTLVREVLDHGVLGVRYGDMLVAGLVLVFFLWVRNLFTRFVLRLLQRGVDRTESSIDNNLIDALRDPIRFIPVVMGVFFATSVLRVDLELAGFFDNLNRSLVVFTLFWSLSRVTEPLGQLLLMARSFFTQAMVVWAVKAGRVVFLVLGAATILELWGIAVGPIIAGLGLFGVAVALGAQDLFRNLIAGMFVIGERRFNVGDWILVDGVVEGTVEEIGFRTTMVRRFDKAPVFVPNGRLADSAMTNFSRMTHRRISWVVGLEYRTTQAQLQAIRDGIEAYLLANPAYAQPPDVSTFVRVSAFSDSSIDLFIYCFTRTTNWGEWLEIKEQLVFEIKRLVEAAGAGFAFPSQSIYVEALPGELVPRRPEAAVVHDE